MPTSETGFCINCDAELEPIYENNGYKEPEGQSHLEIVGFRNCKNCDGGLKEVRTKRHLVISIRGLEDRINKRVPKKYGSWKVLCDENGRFLTEEEVRAEIERCKKLGYIVIPTCDNHDERGYCKGHPVND